MKTFFISFILFCFCVTPTFAQQKQVNATALKNGCRILKSAPSYYISNIHTRKIDDWTVQALLDETTKQGWCSSQSASFPFTFVFELAEEFDLNKLLFHNECQKDYKGICARQVKVETSATGSDRGFVEAGSFTLAEYSTSEFTINAPKTRWVRLTILSNYGNTQYTELMDFKAIGTYTHPEYDATNIVGMWDTNFDWVSINNNDNGYIYGCYKWATGTLSAGTVERRVFSFRWSQADDGAKGWCTVVINKEGTRLSGIWGYNNDYSTFGFWDFEKKSNTPYQCWNEKEFREVKPSYKLKSTTPPPVPEAAIGPVKIRLVDAKTNSVIDGNVAISLNQKTISSGNTNQGVYLAEINEVSADMLVSAKANGYLNLVAEYRSMIASDGYFVLKLRKLAISDQITIRNIHFDQGKFDLLPESFPELDNLVDMMNQNPTMEIELQGHTDNQGDADKNVELSENRVKAVKNYLIRKGIHANRLSVVGYGGSKPISSNAQEETRKLNRRVEFKIIKM